ncbi:MAG TPA: FtsX-like permease family protein [Longimicrobium sp.]|nr:FtsX-like permease family protein [Longimicrobium sp.]
MWRNYLTTAARSMRREWAYALLNVAGLTAGIAVFLLIALYVADESRYDRFNPGSARWNRVAADARFGDREIRAPMTPGPMAAALADRVPAVERTCRMYRTEAAVGSGPGLVAEKGFVYGDPGCMDLLAFPLRSGNAATALARPGSVVLSAAAATRHFGPAPAVGQTLDVDGAPFTVTAVLAKPARGSHARYDYLASLSSLPGGPWIDGWLANNVYTYVKVREGARPADVEDAFAPLVSGVIGPQLGQAMGTTFDQFVQGGGRLRFFLQPVPGIHLHSDLEYELHPNGSLRLLRLLATLAVLVLLIACVNYVNLATARASRRSLEVGMRKTFGAGPAQIRTQFLVEAALASVAATVLGLLLAAALLPAFNGLLGKELSPAALASPPLVFILPLLPAVVALLAGAYPAFMLSGMPPMHMVRRAGPGARGGRRLREGLVVFQFAVAAVLMTTAALVQRQAQFVARADLGFDPRRVVVVEGTAALGERWQGFKGEVLKTPGVLSASGAASLPGRAVREVYFSAAGTPGEDRETAWLLDADADFVRTLGIRVTSGAAFAATANQGVVLLNDEGARQLGWAAPLGRQVEIPADITNPSVVGTVGNLHLESLRKPLRPTVIRPLAGPPGVIAVSVQPGREAQVIQALEARWRDFAPARPFEHRMLSQDIEALYEADWRVMAAVNALTVVAVLIACLGILGLAAFTSEQRTREIGVRKVLGASTASLVMLLSRDYVRLVLVSLVVAVPVAAWLGRRWLSGFTYRVEMAWWVFVLAGGVVMALAFASAASQGVRAARVRPVESLRHE